MTYFALLIAALSGATAMNAVYSFYLTDRPYKWDAFLAGHGFALAVYLVATV